LGVRAREHREVVFHLERAEHAAPRERHAGSQRTEFAELRARVGSSLQDNAIVVVFGQAHRLVARKCPINVGNGIN